jgi:tripartite-type tricarboxylate transporter receptor subunit TctC
MNRLPGLSRRGLLHGAAGIAATAGLTASAGAATKYPDKPITLIVPGPPGGGTDLLARELAEAVKPFIGVRVVVENKPGAGGALGVTLVTEARPDGYSWPRPLPPTRAC